MKSGVYRQQTAGEMMGQMLGRTAHEFVDDVAMRGAKDHDVNASAHHVRLNDFSRATHYQMATVIGNAEAIRQFHKAFAFMLVELIHHGRLIAKTTIERINVRQIIGVKEVQLSVTLLCQRRSLGNDPVIQSLGLIVDAKRVDGSENFSRDTHAGPQPPNATGLDSCAAASCPAK